MNKIDIVLSKLRLDRVEGQTFVYNGNEYPKPYQSIQVDGVKIEGLREMESRASLLKDIVQNNIEKRNRYLDVGSNCGFFVNFFSHMFEKTFGVDYDEYYIDLSKTIYPDKIFLHNDLNRIKLTQLFDKSFDFITALSMIEYVDNKEEFVQDIYSLCDCVSVFEGHSEDIRNNNDLKYESILKSFDWDVTRLDSKTDAGLNARIFCGRPVWICKK